MGIYATLVRRELGGYFGSLIGYIVIAAAAALIGFSLSYSLEAVNMDPEPLDMPFTELFYNTLFFWIILLPTAPLITMRTFAQEKATGTFETLMTAPVGDWQVVLAKFTGAWLFYLCLWTPLFGSLLVIRRYVDDPTILDPGFTGATWLGIGLVGSACLSAGCLASALTRNQIIAAMTAFGLCLGMFILSFFSMLITAHDSWQAAVLRHVSMLDHMRDFVRGVVDTRHVVFYLSLTLFFLFLTTRVVESRRWK